MRSYILALAIIILGASGVLAKAADIEGIQWTLTYANGREVTSALAYFEIERNGRRFTGNTGCNSMFGTVAVKAQTIDFSGIGMTKKACRPEPGNVSEMTFVNALDKAARYSRNGNTLHVFDRNGRTILRFKRLVKQPPVEDPPAQTRLEDRKWVLESINNRKTVAPLKDAFISFDARKGSAGGDSSCNVFGGEYTVTGSKIAIREIVSTMRACIEDERMTIEREFLYGLRTTNRFEIKDGRLFLYRGRNLLLTLRGEAKG
jgi:heat shock protein HslJ